MTRDDLVEDPIRWGHKLIETEDHDPLYSSLVRWNVKGSRLRRFLLTYWCCYSVGASWFISQQSGTRYWELLEKAAANQQGPSQYGYGFDRWPRAHERRHWRGQKSVESVWALMALFRHPEEACLSLESARTLAEVEGRIMLWPQFGPWIAFKAADMVERVLGTSIEFPTNITSLFKDPKEGAELMKDYLGLETADEVTAMLLGEYADMLAPGVQNRACNIQEVETVLCKWKSARKGHYFLGADTKAHKKELADWGAQDLLSCYPG